MRFIRLSALAVAFAAVGLGGCASSPPAADDPDTDRVCVRISQINSFTALNDQYVVVKASANDRYLFTIQRPCTGLTFATGMGIPDQATRVCNDGFSWLSFDDAGLGERRCRILDIEVVADEREAKALIEGRAKD